MREPRRSCDCRSVMGSVYLDAVCMYVYVCVGTVEDRYTVNAPSCRLDIVVYTGK